MLRAWVILLVIWVVKLANACDGDTCRMGCRIHQGSGFTGFCNEGACGCLFAGSLIGAIKEGVPGGGPNKGGPAGSPQQQQQGASGNDKKQEDSGHGEEPGSGGSESKPSPGPGEIVNHEGPGASAPAPVPEPTPEVEKPQPQTEHAPAPQPEPTPAPQPEPTPAPPAPEPTPAPTTTTTTTTTTPPPPPPRAQLFMPTNAAPSVKSAFANHQLNWLDKQRADLLRGGRWDVGAQKFVSRSGTVVSPGTPDWKRYLGDFTTAGMNRLFPQGGKWDSLFGWLPNAFGSNAPGRVQGVVRV